MHQAPKFAEFISSRVARFPPSYEQAQRERMSERELEAFIAAQPHTRYRVVDIKTGESRDKTIVPAQLLEIWSDSVISAIGFRQRWSAAELIRLLCRWNAQKTQWVYLPACDA